MRPLGFSLGLAFVATVLIAHVDAIKCIIEHPGQPRKETDCSAFSDKCLKVRKPDGRITRSCGPSKLCANPPPCVSCCNDKDYCNDGDVPAGPCNTDRPPSVKALHCYYHDTNDTGSDWKDATCKEGYNYCSTLNGTDGRVIRSCADAETCKKQYQGIVVTCCSGDLCNGDPIGHDVPPTPKSAMTTAAPGFKAEHDSTTRGATTCAPPVPLLIAVFTGAIAALSI